MNKGCLMVNFAPEHRRQTTVPHVPYCTGPLLLLTDGHIQCTVIQNTLILQKGTDRCGLFLVVCAACKGLLLTSRKCTEVVALSRACRGAGVLA